MFSRCLLATLLLLGWQQPNAVVAQSAADFPNQITLRAGVLHAPPFAIAQEANTGADDDVASQTTFTGFTPDLLKRLQIFAANDGVSLDFQLSSSPPQYGGALDLVANDCNTTANPNKKEDCERFDLILGDYYVNAERSMRIDFTPAWLRSTISTIKRVETEDIITLNQANKAHAEVCVLSNAYSSDVIRGKFPAAYYVECDNNDECLDMLKAGDCVLYADDELLLRYRSILNPDLEVTREQFNSQYMVWPMSYKLPHIVSQLMKKWMYAAVANATTDDLYFQYFQKELCPVGTAGENCELYCDPVHGEADTRGKCVCESSKWTGDDCTIEVPENTHMIPDNLKILSYAMLGINFGSIILCGFWLYWQRNSVQVRSSQPFFLALVLLGCAISTSTIIALEQEDEGEGDVPACMAIPWLYSVGFSVTFGTLFAKIRRVYAIFKSAARPGAGRISAVTFQETICVVGIVLLIDVFILVIWTTMSPLEWKRFIITQDQFGVSLESEGHCTAEHWGAFAGVIAGLHLLLLCMACYMCFVARKIPTQFSEGKYVSYAMISNLQIFIVGVPILIILGASPATSFFTRCVIIWMNDLVVIALVFGNLIYSVHFHTEEAEPQNVKAAIEGAIQSFAPGAGSSSDRRISGQSSTADAESGQITPNGSNHVSKVRSTKLSSNGSGGGRQPSGASGGDIMLTISELEENKTTLKGGEAHRVAANSDYSAMETPLPKGMLGGSSVSTHVASNAAEGPRKGAPKGAPRTGFMSNLSSTFADSQAENRASIAEVEHESESDAVSEAKNGAFHDETDGDTTASNKKPGPSDASAAGSVSSSRKPSVLSLWT